MALNSPHLPIGDQSDEPLQPPHAADPTEQGVPLAFPLQGPTISHICSPPMSPSPPNPAHFPLLIPILCSRALAVKALSCSLVLGPSLWVPPLLEPQGLRAVSSFLHSCNHLPYLCRLFFLVSAVALERCSSCLASHRVLSILYASLPGMVRLTA